ncbi:glycosyltransferase [Pseudoroseomonas globiformis]|uniref:Glycosyltransferase n=1 Tax=Teichococcus globiformis TaxID=2307229 RepID=A0ABV7FY02_9PROT
MGVIEIIPDDLSVFYGDQYYGTGAQGDEVHTHGYSHYDYTAEHGVSWAAALIKLLCPKGSVLDIGCTNGHLLRKLGPDYEKYGIEANNEMIRVAESHGITVIGNDVLNEELPARYAGKFDVISSIATYEHLSDLRLGIEYSLQMLQHDGVLLFEVPLLSETGNNDIWFSSSLEHVWYPSEEGLRRLIENELGCHLIGSEIRIRNYGSNYVGLVVRDAAKAARIAGLASRVLTRDAEAKSPDERLARMQVGMIHAAHTAHEDVDALTLMAAEAFNPMMLRRLADLWQNDLWRLRLLGEEQQAAAAALHDAQTALRHTEEALRTLPADARRNEIELTRELIAVRQQLRDAATSAPAAFQAGHPDASTQAVPLAEISGEALPGTQPIVAGAVPASSNEAEPAAVLGVDLKVMDITGHRPEPFAAIDGAWPADRPLVSVIITSFNYGKFVEDAINSVLRQTFRNLEVIVVEGGSSEPDSRLRVAELDRSRVRVLMQGGGHRAGANRNFGISQARGKYICCLDADDMLRPTYLEKALFLLERHGFDVVSAALQMFGKEQTVIHIVERPDLDAILEGNHVLTCAVFRRSLWEKAGGYRDTDRTVTGYVYEDWSFWVRLAALGARFLNLAFDPLLLYRVHGTSLSRRSDVVPVTRQRELIRMMNADLITSEAIERSSRSAALRPATPLAALSRVFLEPRNDDGRSAGKPVLLLAMPFLILGGAERLLSSVVGALTSQGWRVIITTSIATDEVHGDTTAWFEPHTCEIFHLPKFLPREYWDDFLGHLVESRGVDLLWIVGSAFAYDNLRTLRQRFTRLQVVDLLFNTVGHTENNRRRRDQIDLTIVENEDVRRWLLEHDETDDRIRLIESGVDLDRLHPGLRSQEWREKVSQNDGDIIVGFCGRWSEEKDPLGFVEIARRADPSWPVRFIMTGTGHLGPEIRNAIDAAGFPAGRFQLLGEVDDISTVLASIDLLVVPSKLDGRPVVVMEALAVGTPVLASEIGGLPSLVRQGRTGWLREAGDADGFVDVIAEVVTNREVLAPMRVMAREDAEERLALRKMLERYEQALLHVLPAQQEHG